MPAPCTSLTIYIEINCPPQYLLTVTGRAARFWSGLIFNDMFFIFKGLSSVLVLSFWSFHVLSSQACRRFCFVCSHVLLDKRAGCSQSQSQQASSLDYDCFFERNHAQEGLDLQCSCPSSYPLRFFPVHNLYTNVKFCVSFTGASLGVMKQNEF